MRCWIAAIVCIAVWAVETLAYRGIRHRLFKGLEKIRKRQNEGFTLTDQVQCMIAPSLFGEVKQNDRYKCRCLKYILSLVDFVHIHGFCKKFKHNLSYVSGGRVV